MQTSLSRRGTAVIAVLLALSACGSDEIASDDTTMTPPSDEESPPSTGGVPETSGPSTTEPDDAPPPGESTTTAPATSAPAPTTTEPSEPAPDPTTTAPATSATTTTAPTASESEPAPTSPPPTSSNGADLDPLVVAAMADLAAAQGRSVDEIDPVRFERVTWRNGALGCPQPGRSYTQALVDGYRIVLLLDGSPYHYHGAGSGPPFPCASPEDPAPGGGGVET